MIGACATAAFCNIRLRNQQRIEGLVNPPWIVSTKRSLMQQQPRLHELHIKLYKASVNQQPPKRPVLKQSNCRYCIPYDVLDEIDDIFSRPDDNCKLSLAWAKITVGCMVRVRKAMYYTLFQQFYILYIQPTPLLPFTLTLKRRGGEGKPWLCPTFIVVDSTSLNRTEIRFWPRLLLQILHTAFVKVKQKRCEPKNA